MLVTKVKLLYFAFGCVLPRILTEFSREGGQQIYKDVAQPRLDMDLLGLVICALQILKIVVLSKKRNFMLLIKLPTWVLFMIVFL